MAFRNSLFSLSIVSTLTVSQALAQGETLTPVEETSPPPQIVEPAIESEKTSGASAAASTSQTGSVAPNTDEMADQLNARQQLQQTFTLERRINGEVVERSKRTVTYDRSMPYRETEAGQSTVESLKSAFDRELLTRAEALEEAQLDFTVADADRSGSITPSEYATLVKNWRENEERTVSPRSAEEARQRKYDAFISELDPDTAQAEIDAFAAKKFTALAGESEAINRDDYIRGYLRAFDSMDEDGDTLLKGNELKRFRAANRGETTEM